MHEYLNTGSSKELVGSSGAELRHNPLSFQLKTRLLRARARERPDIIKKHPLKKSKTLNTSGAGWCGESHSFVLNESSSES